MANGLAKIVSLLLLLMNVVTTAGGSGGIDSTRGREGCVHFGRVIVIAAIDAIRITRRAD
jgi:hypothetical protein